MQQNYNFIEEPTKKALFRMFLPMMAGMILNFAYNIVDSLWVGNILGDYALAALTGATPIVTLMFSFGMGITNGMGILLSNQLAKNEKSEEEKIISSTLIMTLGLSMVLVVILEVFLDKILLFINTDTSIFAYAKAYLAIYLIGMIPSYIFCHITVMLRCYGDSVFQMISMVITSIINAVLDPILIKWIGFHGAAAATVFSQFVSLALVLLYCRKKAYFKINLCSVKKAYFMPATCLNMALTSIIGYCVGGNRRDRASDYWKLSVKFSLMIVSICGVLLLGFAKPVAGIFGCSGEAAALVQHCITFLVWGYLFNAVTQCYMGKINGYGQPEKGMVITILNHIVIRIPFSILLSKTFLGLDGIWITLLVSFVAAFVGAFLIDKQIQKKLN